MRHGEGERPPFSSEQLLIQCQSVKSNREAALELAEHSSTVTKCIVDHAASVDLSAASNDEALVALNS
jgi:hypothetical protein